MNIRTVGAAVCGLVFCATNAFAQSGESSTTLNESIPANVSSQTAGWRYTLRPIPGVTSFETIEYIDGEDRSVLYLTPVTPKFSSPPAIVLLLYRGGTPETMANLSEIGNLVAEYGVWVILPEPDTGGWNVNPYTQDRRTNDVTFLNMVIDDSIAGYNLNPHKIYMSGYSDGAFMAALYACEQPGKIAAAGLIDSEMVNQTAPTCPTQPPLPVVMFDGTDDKRVVYDGEYGQMSVPDSIAFWAQRNLCGATPIIANLPDKDPSDGTTVQLATYAQCSAGALAELYTINGGGHTWPGTSVVTYGLGNTTQDINATEILWSFFKNYSR